jgi:histidinol-phosphate/aromatic aminotransferase/cobyric acid decarboxylase-like protein
MNMIAQDLRKQLRPLLENLCFKVSEYDRSFGQAREEALAAYGNCFNETIATIDNVLKASQVIVPPDEYAEYYHNARMKGLKPYTFAEYQVQCANLAGRGMNGK